jgi:DNA-cytosine methyltransferase
MSKKKLTYGSLFAGIGGFDLGFDRAGLECKWQVEIDDFCTAVLEKHWPDVTRYRNVREIHGLMAHTYHTSPEGRRQDGGEILSVAEPEGSGVGSSSGNGERCPACLEPVDVICGGFPCQPFSAAGKRRGEDDDRNLWPEFKRLIAEIRPRWVVAENVLGLRTLYIDQVLSDLERLGYTVETLVIPAVAFDAKHRRDRFWIVAYSALRGKESWAEWWASYQSGKADIMANAERLERRAGAEIEGELRKSSESGAYPDYFNRPSAPRERQNAKPYQPSLMAYAERDEHRHEERGGAEKAQGISGIDRQEHGATGESGRAGSGGLSGNGHIPDTIGEGLAQRQGQRGNDGQEQPALERGGSSEREAMGDTAGQRPPERQTSRQRDLISAVEHRGLAGGGPAEWFPEPNVGRVASGLSSALDGTLRRFGYENGNDQEAFAEIDFFRGEILRNMWEKQCQVEQTPYPETRNGSGDSLYRVSHLRTHEEWNLGQRIEKDEELRYLWKAIYSKPLEETQDMQQELLERIRTQERNEKVASSRVDRLKALGNAVVPQIPEFIGRLILEVEEIYSD